MFESQLKIFFKLWLELKKNISDMIKHIIFKLEIVATHKKIITSS